MNGTYENIDCMELMATLKDKEIDLAIVDPPYGINQDGSNQYTRDYYPNGQVRIKIDKRNGRIKKVKTAKHSIEKKWDLSQPNQNYFDELFRVSRNQIIWGANYIKFAQKEKSTGMIFWDKFTAEEMSFSDGELAWCSLFNGVHKVSYMWNGMLQGKSIMEGNVNQGNKKLCEIKFHPTQKPVKLYEWLLSNYAKPNDLILDTHCGSASSLIACENLGFKYIASELDKDYYHQSIQRLEAHLAQGKLFQRVGRDQIQLSQPSMFA